MVDEKARGVEVVRGHGGFVAMRGAFDKPWRKPAARAEVRINTL
jgi:hypothetical protein